MERIKRSLSILPTQTLSILTFMAIIWLTLAPKPLGENPPPLFPGADKLVHAIMFGGFTAMLLLDWQRKHGWQAVKPIRVGVSALIGATFGVVIEYAQGSMNMGRGFEYQDMLADTIGSLVAAVYWLFGQKSWITKNP